MRKGVALGLIMCLLLMGTTVLMDGAEADEVEQVAQITTHDGTSRHPSVSGDHIVYVDDRSGNWNVILSDVLTGKEMPITRSPSTAESSSIHDGKLIYTMNGGDSIHMFDMVTEEEHMVADPYLCTGPATYGDWVIWLQKGSRNDTVWELVAFRGGPEGPTQTESVASDIGHFEGYPSIHGNIVVWEDSGRVFMHDLGEKETDGVTTYKSVQRNPAIDGGRIVWDDFRNGNWDIYMYDLGTGEETQVTTDSTDQWDPDIYGDLIVWTDLRDGNRDIYMYDAGTGEETPVTSNASVQRRPAISEEYIVWEDERNGNWDIYLYDLDPDTDGDGTDDSEDDYPSDPAASRDTDGDGHPDRWVLGMTSGNSTSIPPLRLDSHPMDPAASADTDEDGYPNEWNPGMTVADSTSEPPLRLDQFPGDPAASLDTDGDGAPDEYNPGKGVQDSTTFPKLRLDLWPNDPAVCEDTDGDGYPDEWCFGMTKTDSTTDPPLRLDDFPEDPAVAFDTDGDGYPNGWLPGMTKVNSTTDPPLSLDTFPGDEEEWFDTDGDGVGDNGDVFHYDIAASVDSDRDGYPDEWNEGMTKEDSTTGLRLDKYPKNSKKWKDEPASPSLGLLGAICAMALIAFVVRRRERR